MTLTMDRDLGNYCVLSQGEGGARYSILQIHGQLVS